MKALGKDGDGDAFDESWKYTIAVGILIYLATNSRPDIACSVNQCTRFTHSLKTIHVLVVKRIGRYLQGTKDQGMSINPSSSYNIDCCIYADFGGL